MKEFKGTPGSWKIDDVEFVVCGAKCICAVGGIPFSAEDKANISLIAAAPDLLEALQDMLSGWKYIREQHGDLYGIGWDRAQDKATAAISKALGEE